MKFTKEQAIEALKAKIPTKDKDLDLGRTISEAVDNSIELIGENSEMELNDFVEKAFKQVKTSIGLTHSENSKVAQKKQTQIDEMRQKLGLQDTPPKETPKVIKSEDPAIQAILDKMNAMEAKIAQTEKEKSVSEKRNQLIAKMKESIKDEEWINAYLAEISVTEETDVEAKAKDYVAFYNKTHAKGGKITPKSTDNNEDVDSNVKSVIAAAAAYKKTMSSGRGTSNVVSTTENK